MKNLAFLALAVGLIAIANGADAQDRVEMTLEDAASSPPEAALNQSPAPLRFSPRVWREGQFGKLRVLGAPAKLPLEITNSQGKRVWKVKAPQGDSTWQIPVSQAGFYTLNAPKMAPVNFAVVPQPAPAVSVKNPARLMFGVQTHFAHREMPDESYQMLHNLGVDFVRDEAGWAPMEKEKGVWRLVPRHEDYMAKLKAAKIPLLVSLSYGNPIYQKETGRHPDNPAAYEGYGRYAAEVLRRYGENIFAVEILNEPNKVKPVEEYLPTLKSAHEKIRAAGFKQEIISVGGAGPIGGGMVLGFAREIFQNGAAKWCDSFSQHPYMAPHAPDACYPTENPPYNANLDLALTRAAKLVEEQNLSGSWATEVGWPAPFPIEMTKEMIEKTEKPQLINPMVSLEKQAAFTARLLLEASKYPLLKGITVYDFQDDGPKRLSRKHNFGLVRQDLTPKPAYLAYAVTANFLRDKTFVRTWREPDSYWSANLYRDQKGELWLAAWALEVTGQEMKAHKAKTPELPRRFMDWKTTAQLRLTGAKEVSGFDWQGQPLANSTDLSVSNLPSYWRVGRDEKAIGLETLGVQRPEYPVAK